MMLNPITSPRKPYKNPIKWMGSPHMIGVFVEDRPEGLSAWRVPLGYLGCNLGGPMGAGCHGPVSCAKQHPTYKSKYNPIKIAGNYCSTVSLWGDCTMNLFQFFAATLIPDQTSQTTQEHDIFGTRLALWLIESLRVELGRIYLGPGAAQTVQKKRITLSIS
jgi:hypothetical protein